MRRWRSARSATSARSRRWRAAADGAAPDAADDRRRDLPARRRTASSHERFLVETLKFADRNSGFQELLRGGRRRPRRAGGAGGHDEAVDALFDVGIPSQRSDARARVAGARHRGPAQHAADADGARNGAPTASRPSRWSRKDSTCSRRISTRRRSSPPCGAPTGTRPTGSPTRHVDADPHREAGLLMDYRQSGVDIDAGNETVRRIKSLARAHLHARRAVRYRIVRRPVPAGQPSNSASRCWCRAPTASARSSRSRS